MGELNQLIEEKKRIDKKINEEREKIKIQKRNNHRNVLVRISKSFDDQIEYILEKRKELFPEERISKPGITKLIMNHQEWGIMKKNIISFDFSKDI